MTCRYAPLALLLLSGCGSLAENEDGVAILEIYSPANLYLEQNLPLHLRAVARDRNGDSVSATVVWRTPDTTLTVDSALGMVTAKYDTGTGRIQAATGHGTGAFTTDLGLLTFQLTPRADTLVLVGADSLDVPVGTQASPPLQLRLDRVDSAGASPVRGRPITFRILEPQLVAGQAPAATLAGGRQVDSLVTAATGSPSTDMTVVRVTGKPSPARVVVEANAFRASGDTIPGSGRRFVIRFANP